MENKQEIEERIANHNFLVDQMEAALSGYVELTKQYEGWKGREIKRFLEERRDSLLAGLQRLRRSVESMGLNEEAKGVEEIENLIREGNREGIKRAIAEKAERWRIRRSRGIPRALRMPPAQRGREVNKRSPRRPR